MSEHRESLALPSPAQEVILLCREAINNMGFGLIEHSADHLRASHGDMKHVYLDIRLRARDAQHTDVSVTATLMGFGPMVKQAVRRDAGRFVNELTVLSDKGRAEKDGAPTRRSLSDELQQLATLHERGILTDEEFKAAKGRLMEA